MARPCKSVAVMSKNLTKEEKEKRLDAEEKIKGRSDNIFPPTYLTIEQQNIFNYIVEELEESGILGNLDIYILAQTSIAINRLQYIEDLINDKPELILNKGIMSAKDKYTKDFFRCCNELSLSPQSRAKFANINLQTKQTDTDPVLQALRGGGE